MPLLYAYVYEWPAEDDDRGDKTEYYVYAPSKKDADKIMVEDFEEREIVGVKPNLLRREEW